MRRYNQIIPQETENVKGKFARNALMPEFSIRAVTLCHKGEKDFTAKCECIAVQKAKSACKIQQKADDIADSF